MELVTLVVAAAAFAGTYTAATLPKDFDPIEYSHIIAVVVDSTRAVHQCSDRLGPLYHKFAQDLNTHTMVLDEYVANKAGRKDIEEAAQRIRDLTINYLTNDKGSDRHCVHKFSEIQSSARTLARVLGGSNKFDVCDSNVEERFDLYKASYTTGKITQEELEDLQRDLLKLRYVDTKACTRERANKMEKTLDSIKAFSANM